MDHQQILDLDGHKITKVIKISAKVTTTKKQNTQWRQGQQNTPNKNATQQSNVRDYCLPLPNRSETTGFAHIIEDSVGAPTDASEIVDGHLSIYDRASASPNAANRPNFSHKKKTK